MDVQFRYRASRHEPPPPLQVEEEKQAEPSDTLNIAASGMFQAKRAAIEEVRVISAGGNPASFSQICTATLSRARAMLYV